MTAPAISAKDFLIAAGVVAVSGAWTVKVGRLVDSPDQMVVVTDTGGQIPNPAYLLDYKTFQVLVRGKPDDYSGAYDQAIKCKDVLLGMNPVDVGADRWSGVTGLGDIGFLRYDEKNRPLFSVNFRLFFEPAPNALSTRESL